MSATQKKPTLCFIGHNAYGMIMGNNSKHAGGIERQISLMASWFVNNGYEVTVITWDEGYEDETVINGVKLIKLCSVDAGVKILRFFYPRWTSLIRALNKSKADLYYYGCGDLALGQIVMWARINNKKIIYSVANQIDCTKELEGIKTLRERVLYKYGIRNVNNIIVQTKKQQSLLRENYGLISKVIHMPSTGFQYVENNRCTSDSSKYINHVLWIGRFTPEKRLEWLLDIAGSMKDVCFNVIGAANVETEYSRRVTLRAKSLSNVVLHGRIQHDEIAAYFSNIKVLCCTSVYEGFPNVFLESWSLGVPVVTSFDPDDVVLNYGLGLAADSYEELISSLDDLLSSERSWKVASKASKMYFEKYHTVEKVMPKFEYELNKLYVEAE